MGFSPGLTPATTVEDRVLDAARSCCDRWGIHKVTIDDIATEAGISRATLYRLFPGGRDVLFEAMRERDVRTFLVELDAHLADAPTFEDLLVRILTHATQQLRNDVHLQLMLASEPGVVAYELGVESLPNTIRIASALIGPRVEPYIGADQSVELSEWLARVVVSYFLAPSELLDLGEVDDATSFVRRFIIPAFPPVSSELPAHTH
jgi:AcrR family transcriptional regulator